MTPYAGSKIVNEILKENGIKEIPPQMVYNYSKKGYIVSGTLNGKIDITEENLMVWIVKYLAKKGVEVITDTEVEGQLQLEV